MKIYLIRHGKTEANLQHLYCGSTDLPLSEIGKNELLERKDNVTSLISVYGKNLRFATSGMKRCNETLKILFGEVDFEVIDEFREIDFGVFEMHSYEELKDDPDYQIWISGDNQANIPPSGESGNQMKARVVKAFRELTKDMSEIEEDTMAAGGTKPRDTVLVTHGGVIAKIMEEYFPDEEKNMYQWQPKPGEGYEMIFFDGTWRYNRI